MKNHEVTTCNNKVFFSDGGGISVVSSLALAGGKFSSN